MKEIEDDLVEGDKRMGGAAYEINGTIDDIVLKPRPIKKTFVDRLLGKQRFEGPKETCYGNMTIIELPLGRLDELKNLFMKYLKDQLVQPSEASKDVLEYLKLVPMRINFRGHKEAQEEVIKWTIQVSFSGCAGMAQVSASLAAHWVRLWYLKNRSALQKEIFSVSGFFSNEPEVAHEPEAFLPISQGLYAMYHEEPQEMFINDEDISSHFEINSSFLDTQADGGVELLNEIESKYLSVMADGKCRCQLCAT